MHEPTQNLAAYRSMRKVLAGEINHVEPGGCYVRNTDGTAHFRNFDPELKMISRYKPVRGDFWLIYGDGYEAICPRDSFRRGYVNTDLQAGAPLRLTEAEWARVGDIEIAPPSGPNEIGFSAGTSAFSVHSDAPRMTREEYRAALQVAARKPAGHGG